jgi:Na+/phosphate symporter
MAISSKTIQTLQAQSDKLYDTYLIMNELINNVTLIKSDYEKTKKDLSNILEELRDAEAKNIIDMKKQIESVSDVLTKKIDDSLQKLHEHYHVTTNDVSQSLQMLSQKNKLKGYVK